MLTEIRKFESIQHNDLLMAFCIFIQGHIAT